MESFAARAITTKSHGDRKTANCATPGFPDYQAEYAAEMPLMGLANGELPFFNHQKHDETD